MKSKLQEMEQGLQTAYFDSSINSNLAYKPQFVSNDYKLGKKVLSTIEQELKKCNEFYISVAFITDSGIAPLLQTLKELESRNICGKILTTNYLTFSDPKALHKLNALKNIELRMYYVEGNDAGFHTKGYIFHEEELYKIIVGSSNMTMSALTTNKEWNTKIISTENGEYAQHILNEFTDLWHSSQTKTFDEFIELYTVNYEMLREQRETIKHSTTPSIQQYKLKPNSMQVAFINNLEKIQSAGEKKALLISATGTGKTYASAFALRSQNPRKALFLVHREQIAKQAIASYRHVFGDTKSMQLLSGNSQDYFKIKNADFVFSTMQMMAKPEVMERFAKNEFQTIIVDEVHRAGAESYQRIMHYFTPDFYLGMTASPDRPDGFDIYSLFDHNIAYEIRLQEALEENLLCPFHYFGITDLEIDGETFDDTSGDKDLRKFNLLTSDDRVNYVIEKAEYFGYSGDRVKGLIFCSTKNEARVLSAKFNERGYHTAFLSGDDSQQKREETIDLLLTEGENHLDYIFTVDIFNEGVDIPEINQVIMLRPTESPIIFIQQLGRGLRKAQGKEFVIILDFIGNYTNNFMIPIALSGDKSYNKDSIRRYVSEGSRIIPGSSTLHFDEITKKRIYESIDTANFSDVKLLKDSYRQLKNKLGRIPNLLDFDEYGEIDVLRIFDNKSLGSYYKFLVKYEKDYSIRLSDTEEKYVEYICKKFASGKRVHELELLKRLLHYHNNLFVFLRDKLASDYKIKLDENAQVNIVNILTNEFATGTGKKTYSECVFVEKTDDDICASRQFLHALENPDFFSIVEELVEFGLHRNKKDYGNRYMDTSFQLYSKYTYDDVCRLLNWEKGGVPLNISGYKYDKTTKTYPVFINYDKDDNIQDTVKYEDRFINTSTLIAISKSRRTLQSDDVYTALHAKELGVDIELFVRKNKDGKDSKEFYYLGKINATGKATEFIMPNTTKTAVEIEYHLVTPIREDLYEYITS